eukprot:COSAG06_NODE_1066_length_10841_cov_14.808806_7_plen_113_part_00
MGADGVLIQLIHSHTHYVYIQYIIYICIFNIHTTIYINILCSQAAQREAAIVTSPWLAHERHKREIERCAEFFVVGTLFIVGNVIDKVIVCCSQTGIAGRPEPPPPQQQQGQ